MFEPTEEQRRTVKALYGVPTASPSISVSIPKPELLTSDPDDV